MHLVGELAHGTEGGVEVEAHLGEEGEVGTEPGHHDDLVDVGHLLAVDRADDQAAVCLAW